MKRYMKRMVLRLADMCNLNYRDIDFSHSNFVEANMEQTCFSNCDFVGCTFEETKMTYSVFENCNFSISNFRGAFLNNSKFKNCTFNGCDLRYVEASETKFVNCGFVGANFEFINVNSITSFKECDLTEVHNSPIPLDYLLGNRVGRKWLSIEVNEQHIDLLGRDWICPENENPAKHLQG